MRLASSRWWVTWSTRSKARTQGLCPGEAILGCRSPHSSCTVFFFFFYSWWCCFHPVLRVSLFSMLRRFVPVLPNASKTKLLVYMIFQRAQRNPRHRSVTTIYRAVVNWCRKCWRWEFTIGMSPYSNCKTVWMSSVLWSPKNELMSYVFTTVTINEMKKDIEVTKTIRFFFKIIVNSKWEQVVYPIRVSTLSQAELWFCLIL